MKILGFEIKKQNRTDKRSISSDDPYLMEYFTRLGLIDTNSTTVTDGGTAMRLATVYRCVSILSGTIASLPLRTMRRKGEYFMVDEESELYPIFSHSASRRQTFYDMMENAIIQMLLDGNAYIFIQRRNGEASELVLCSQGSATYDKYLDKYTIRDSVNGIVGTFDAWQVIHLRNKSLDGGYTGVSTITYAARSLGITANADDQTLKELKGGNKMKGFVTGGDIASGLGKFQDGQIDVVKERLNSELASGANIMRMPAGVEFRQISISPADAQLLETRKFSVFEICRFFGVHPDKVFAEQSSNYKASENSQVSFLTDTLQPILSKIEAEFKFKLIPRNLSAKRKIEYGLDALYQVDLKTKADYYKGMLEIGALTTNEIRKRENLSPVQGGDVPFVSCNIAPIDSLKIKGETVNNQAKQDENPPEPPKNDPKTGKSTDIPAK